MESVSVVEQYYELNQERRGGKEELAATHAAQFSEHTVGPLLHLINFILRLSVIPVFKSTITSNGI